MKINFLAVILFAINALTASAKLDVENNWGHRQTCEWSFTPERLH